MLSAERAQNLAPACRSETRFAEVARLTLSYASSSPAGPGGQAKIEENRQKKIIIKEYREGRNESNESAKSRGEKVKKRGTVERTQRGARERV